MSQKDIHSKNNSYAEAPTEVDIETQNKPLISKDDKGPILDNKNLQWSFMKKSTGIVVLLYSISLVAWNLFLMDRSIYKNLLRGYTNVNAYPIVSMIILVGVFIFAAVLPKIGRLISFPLTLIVFVLTTYLSIFYVNWNSKPRFNDYDKFISA